MMQRGMCRVVSYGVGHRGFRVSPVQLAVMFSKSHEWVNVEGDVATVGITRHAQEELKEIVFVDLTVENGEHVGSEDVYGAVESVKATSELFSPCSGEVTAVHTELNDNLDAVNEDPEGAGWMMKLKGVTVADDLMTADAYAAYVAEGH